MIRAKVHPERRNKKADAHHNASRIRRLRRAQLFHPRRKCSSTSQSCRQICVYQRLIPWNCPKSAFISVRKALTTLINADFDTESANSVREPSKRRAIRHLIETEAFHRSGQRSLRIHCCAPHCLEAAALFLAGVDESERLHERGISRVGNTTSEHNVLGNAQTARVLDLTPVGIVDGGAVACPHRLALL